MALSALLVKLDKEDAFVIVHKRISRVLARTHFVHPSLIFF